MLDYNVNFKLSRYTQHTLLRGLVILSRTRNQEIAGSTLAGSLPVNDSARFHTVSKDTTTS